MVKHFSSYLLFSILNSGITFVISVFLARSLSVESFGIIGIFLAVLYFVKPLANFNTIGLVPINKVELNHNDFQIFANNYFSLQVILFFILFSLSLFFYQIFPEYKFLILFLPFLSFIMTFTEFHNSELIQDKNSTQYGLFILINRIFILFFTVVFIKILNFDWTAYLWALLLAESITLLIRFNKNFISLKKFSFLLNKNEIKNIMIYGLPLFVALLAGWGLNQSDKFIVLHYFSLKEVAFYTVAYSLGVIINTINQALTNTVVPIIYNALKENRAKKLIKKYTLYYAVIISIIIFFIGISAKYFILLFYGKEYIESITIIILISVAFGFNGIYRVSGLVIEYYKLNVLKTKLVFIAMLINLIVSILLINLYGIFAPAIGTIIAYIFLAFSSQYYGYKILKEQSETIY